MSSPHFPGTVVSKVVRLGLTCGLCLSAMVLLASPWLPCLFTQDAGVRALASKTLPLVALGAVRGWRCVQGLDKRCLCMHSCGSRGM